MKKLFTILFCLYAIVAGAEEMKMALLQPRVAEGSDPCRPIELNMVRGELRKAFGWQSEFQVLTRTDVDAMLEEHGFQRTGMVDDNQRKEVGAMTGAQYICVSTITKEGTQLYIEAYLVNIETGQMTNPATQFTNVTNNDYSTLQGPCNELAKEMLGNIGETSTKSYKVSVGMSSRVTANYVDLGLPSGTLWKSENEDCGLITFDQAYYQCGSNLPTKQQWEELIKFCIWSQTENGYIVKGKNGNSIFFLAAGRFDCEGDRVPYLMGTNGYYWSRTPTSSGGGWYLYFYSKKIGVADNNHCRGRSVRLIK